jgi:hypothetical protein
VTYMYVIVTDAGGTVALDGQTYDLEEESEMDLPELLDNGWVPVRETSSRDQWLVLLSKQEKP